MNTDTAVPLNERIALTLDQAAKAIGIPRNTLRDACYRGELKSTIRCRKRMILRADLEQWLQPK